MLRSARVTGHKYAQLDHGYAWDEKHRHLYRWRNPSPPFYGRIVSAAELRVGLPDLGHHANVRTECQVIETKEPMFCIVLHDHNISNCVAGSWTRELIVGDAKELAIMRFGL